MDAPFVSISKQMSDSISSLNDTMGPEIKTVQMENPPSSGFSALDNMATDPIPDPTAPTKPAKAEKPADAPPLVDKFDQRMSKLTSQAQKIRQEQMTLKAEREQMAADLAELKRFRELKAIAKEDPVALAEAFEFKPDEYAATLIEKGAMSPDRRRLLEQQKEIAELKTWKQQQEDLRQQQQVQSSAQAVRAEMAEFVKADPEKYDLVQRTGAYDKVLAKISIHWQATAAEGEPELMSYEDAFAAVESELEQQYAPLLESPKLRTRMGAAASPTATSSGQAAARKPAGTINSKMRGSTSRPPEKMSEAERLQKAGEVFLNQIYGRRG